MVPHNIKIKNYKSYGDNETTIDLSNNSVKLVYGNIGAGKTTFVDGIIWCLYGESLVNIDEVINRKTKKNCKVEFNFSIGKDYFSIIRYRKHETYGGEILVFKNHKNISPVKKKDTQELINSIVGMNHKAMISSVMFSSEIYISFLRVKESKRLDIFDSVLNMNVFKKWNDATKKMRHPVEEEFNTAKVQIDKLLYGKDTILGSIQEYKEEAKRKLQKLKTERQEMILNKETLKKDIEKFQHIDVDKELALCREYKEAKEKNKSLYIDLKRNEDELKDVNEKLDKLCENYSNDKLYLESLEKINYNEEMEKLEQEGKNENIKSQIQSLKDTLRDVSDIERQINIANKKIKELQKKMSDTGTNICYTCGQLINKELMDKLTNDLIEEDSDVKKEIMVLSDRREDIERTNKETMEKIESLKGDMMPVHIIHTKEELKNLEESKYELKKSLEMDEKEIEWLGSAKRGIEHRIEEIKKYLTPEPEMPVYSEEFLSSFQENVKEKKEELNSVDQRIKTINEQAKTLYSREYIEGLEKKIVNIEQALITTNKVKKEKEEELKHHNYLLKLLSNKDYGIKKYVISKMIDMFNKNINKYIPLFFDRDIKIEFDKNLKESIYENKQEISFNSFSSGEKSLLDISIAFSLYMLVKNFFSSNVQFLVFDEILDRNLDEEGIQAILQVINELSKDNSIMVISHRIELQESFEHRIRVYKEDGFSKIESTF